VRMLPRRVPVPLADVELRAIHGRANDASSQRRARNDRVFCTRTAASDPYKLGAEGNERATDRQDDNAGDHRTCTTPRA
jgi:hypothetical protein